MTPFRLTVALCSLLSIGLTLADAQPGALNGPDYAPPFEIKQGERVDGELRTETFLDKQDENRPALAASWVYGNKRVAARETKLNLKQTDRDNEFTLYVNEAPIMKCIFVANYINADGENVPMMAPKLFETSNLEADPDTGVIRVSNRYPLPDGTEAEFSYSLKSLGDSRVEVSWDIGCSAEQVEAFREAGVMLNNYVMYFDIEGDYRENGLEVNGTSMEPKPIDELKAHEQDRLVVWQGTVHELSYAPSKPFYGFDIISESGLRGRLREVYQYKRIDLGFMFHGSQPQDSFIIDFGKVAPPADDAPPAVEGHDLWAQDALHLPQSPTRNLFPNPSFEQGMRYWRWWFGGARYERSDLLRYGVDPDAGLFGSNAMVIHPVQRASQTLRSFSMPSAKGKTYTVSYYAKAEIEGASAFLAPLSSKTGGQFTRATVYATERNELSTEWQRFSFSFVSDGTPISFILSANEKGAEFGSMACNMKRGLSRPSLFRLLWRDSSKRLITKIMLRRETRLRRVLKSAAMRLRMVN
ncbi:carbohydrate binding domain-containing protein [Coraliomargarita algicola]|uniref:Carbohydrate binding domain-containing protein n=1 Tax=Coraliomargarita algicola TaxID=3092156 RepID=A0ABZ0RLD4_9BACT|nr:carbohydrate binding domain-containing protein [Coraliomargarita sp. J2-16]WPJ95585.1 carbohydrate binding domain-containing protein [Coraliomargarita sp. J2-16]